MAQMVKNLPAMQETRIWSLGWENPLKKGMATTPVFLPRKSQGQRSLAGYSPWSCKELSIHSRLWCWESWLTVEGRSRIRKQCPFTGVSHTVTIVRGQASVHTHTGQPVSHLPKNGICGCSTRHHRTDFKSSSAKFNHWLKHKISKLSGWKIISLNHLVCLSFTRQSSIQRPQNI